MLNVAVGWLVKAGVCGVALANSVEQAVPSLGPFVLTQAAMMFAIRLIFDCSGVIVMVMGVVGTLMTALTIAREMESGNVVLLRTTPLARGEFLAGKLLPYFVVGMIDVLGSVAAAVFIFDVPLRGSLLELAGVSALFLLVVMAQGALISLNAGNQVQVHSLARAGERIRARSTLVGARRRSGARGGDMVFFETLNHYTETGGRPLLTERQSMVFRL